MIVRAIVAIALTALVAGRVAAQDARTVTAARQLRAGDSLRVVVDHATGPLRVHATAAPLLYDLTLRYDPARSSLLRTYDPDSGVLRVGMDTVDAPWHFQLRLGLSDEQAHHPNALTLALGRGVPLDLSLDFGASEAVLDLSELTVVRLAMTFGASDTRVHFGTPNPARMRALHVSANAGSLTMRGLGNANAHRIEIDGVAAGIDLDFSGAWEHDMEIDADVVLGGVVLRVPEDVGVRLVVRRDLLASMETAALTSRDGARYSANWDTAPRKLTVSASALLGGLELRRFTR